MAILKHRFPRGPKKPLHRIGLTGTSPATLVDVYERLGNPLGAGLMYARVGKTEDALRCAGMCEGRRIDVIRIYLAVGMRAEAAETALMCTGNEAFETARLLLGHLEIDGSIAKGCADRFLKNADPATLGEEKRAVLHRVYLKAGDYDAANRFAPPAWRPRKRGMPTD